MDEELLLKALEELITDKLKKFKWFLKKNGSISPSVLEKADKATEIVDVMVERFEPEGAVKITLEILRKMNENHLAKQLENWTETTEKNDPINPKKVQQPDQVDGRNAPISERQLQPIQSDWKRPDRIIPCTQEFKDKILRENRDDVYIPKNKSQRKRSALLITNIKFKHISYRHGAERDEENMEWLLEALGYSVKKHTDLTGEKIDAAVEEFALSDHKDSDSTFVVIMSHGTRIENKDAIAGVNYHKDLNPNDVFFVDTIFTRLNSENCPALIDKPKVILIQACRGGDPGGVKMSDSTRDTYADDSSFDSDAWVHKEKDFTCFMSTLPDIKAYRHTVSGSFFVMYIVEVFCEWAHDTHIMQLFRKVSLGMEKHSGREKKLLPCIERTPYTKDFYLFPGL